MAMTVTNQTTQDYWFGPLHLDAGVGTTLSVDDTSDTSLYLTSDVVADAINNLYLSGKIIESELGVVVVEGIEAHPDAGSPGRAKCRRFEPVHQSNAS